MPFSLAIYMGTKLSPDIGRDFRVTSSAEVSRNWQEWLEKPCGKVRSRGFKMLRTRFHRKSFPRP